MIEHKKMAGGGWEELWACDGTCKQRLVLPLAKQKRWLKSGKNCYCTKCSKGARHTEACLSCGREYQAYIFGHRDQGLCARCLFSTPSERQAG